MRSLPFIAAVTVASIWATVATSCKDDSNIETAEVMAGDVPTMMTRDVETLISDSGVTDTRSILRCGICMTRWRSLTGVSPTG